MKVNNSDYIKYSRTLIRKLHANGCYGKGSIYEDNLLTGVPDKSIAKIVLDALVKQDICCKKEKNMDGNIILIPTGELR